MHEKFVKRIAFLKPLRPTRRKVQLLLIALLLVGVLGAVYLAQQEQDIRQEAAQIPIKEAYERSPQALTNRMLQETKSANKERARTLARDRKGKLKTLMQKNPRAFLDVAIPKSVRDSLPEEIKTDVEETVTVTGILFIEHKDYFGQKTSETQYLLVPEGEKDILKAVSEKRFYRLYFAKNPSRKSHSRVKVQGVKIENEIALYGEGESGSAGTSLQALSSVSTPAVTSANLAVILIKFNDTATEPFTPESINTKVFGDQNSLVDYYRKNSFNLLSMTGRVLGWYQVNYPGSGCRTTEWGNAGAQAAKDAGVDMSVFSNIMFVFPHTGGCGLISGSATLGGKPGYTYIFTNDVGVMVHELGHNFGLNHASFRGCGTEPTADSGECSFSEYGDRLDAMGVAALRHFNAPHKLGVGWIPESQIERVSQSGVYTVGSVNAAASQKKVVLIENENSDRKYYLEFRQPIDYDTTIETRYFSGVSIRRWDEVSGSRTILINPLIEEGEVIDNSFPYSPYLFDGTSFEDKIAGIKITQTSHTTNSATVQVSFQTLPMNSFLGQWQTSGSLPQTTRSSNIIFDKGYAYMVGGVAETGEIGRTLFRSVLSSRIEQGVLSGWVQQTQLPFALEFPNIVVDKEYIYAQGLQFVSGSGLKLMTYSARLLGDGTVGTWQVLTDLPLALPAAELVAAEGHLYVHGTIYDTVQGRYISAAYSAEILPNGMLGAWGEAPVLPFAVKDISLTTYNSRIYAVGGFFQNSDFGPRYSVYVQDVSSDGTPSSWRKTTSLPRGLQDASVYSSPDGYLFVLGGQETNLVNSVFVAKVQSDGTLGQWTKSANMPESLKGAAIFAQGNTLFIGGGRGLSGLSTRIYKTLYTPSAPTPTFTPTPTRTPTPSPTRTPTPIGDTTPPKVSVTSPLENTFVLATKVTTITATATDASGIKSVEFLVNGVRVCTDTSTPYTCNWSVPAASRAVYRLSARATDIYGNTKTSSEVKVLTR